MKKNAFTLIELAIVLTIVGLMIGGSFKLLKSSRERSYITEAKEQVKIAKDAIIGDALTYGNLPVVEDFDQNLSPIDNNKSKEQFFYYPDNNLSTITENICTFDKTYLQVYIMNDNAVERIIDNVAFVVAAQSANRNIQTGVSSNGTMSIVKVYKPYNKKDDNSNDFIRNFDEYDDVVQWVTLQELQKSIDCSASKLVIVNDYALPRDANCTTESGDQGCYLGKNNNVSLVATGGYPYSDDSDVNNYGDSDSDSEEDYLWCVEADVAFDNNFTVECPSSVSIVNTNPNYCDTDSNFHQCTSPILDSKFSNSNDINLSAGSYFFTLYVKDKTKKISKKLSIAIDSK